MLNLDGKVAVVTGGGRGLGLAVSRALAKAGAAVVVNDLDADVAQQAVDAILAEGGRAVAQAAAIGSSQAAQLCVDAAVEQFGRLDIMCANAGILRDKVLWNMTDDDFDQVVETHLRGTFTCARAAVRRFREQGDGGRLLLVSSLAGQRGNFGQTNYAAAKAGIAAMARTWALECARFGVTVNAVLPTALTQMVATIPFMQPYVKLVEQGRDLPPEVRLGMGMGQPEDVAPLFVFLASQAAREITGQCIGLGGGKLALWSHPQEIRTAYSDSGWTAEKIAQLWSSSVGQELESFGIPPIAPPQPESN
ncbi:MAG TPA: SDR family NAD(P)-dependent oxidoreductase [Eoetvoesiella sp.]|jgi:NAD(P)-dependent dehydrogenase (short-subunit alcohol dehydrogenase family)|uniref:SDR family NAD(P)-dependent oxidoreductase n=1 Tax=Eoetvoesiella sp. TaxID=1966355 RepID=UPI002BF90A37|nr:SDR family NAD(P)-dependent oxidoreductase [Eoetvoesiella sp.]HWK60713.1 SDR family NAD(P)-dependent oxidoreductase [Eoetvoesiella sp.]